MPEPSRDRPQRFSPVVVGAGVALVVFLLIGGFLALRDGGDEDPSTALSEGADTERFCDLMEEFVDLADGLAAGEADVEAVAARVGDLIQEAEAVAPPVLAPVLDSNDPADQQLVTELVEQECGIVLPPPVTAATPTD